MLSFFKKKFLLIGGLLCLLCLIVYIIAPYFSNLNFKSIKDSYNESLILTDRNNIVLREVTNSSGNYAYWLDFEEIPPFVLDSLVAAEDENFYSHRGVDYRAVIRALWGNIRKLEVHSGASTISMQLARLVKKHKRSLSGKIAQVFTARALEVKLTKEQILTLYINMVPMGSGNSGLEAGAKEYFDTSLNLLSRSQVATLIGIIQGPSLYNPRRNNIGAIKRRDYVLNQLLNLGYIDSNSFERAKREELVTYDRSVSPIAMHFTDYVIFENQTKKFQGLQKTSLDSDLNSKIEDLLRIHIDKMKKDGITHGSILVLDNRTMDILAMVGSPDYWDGDKGSNNGVVTRRQPGSTLKPFTYAKAFELGKNPSDVISDIPVSFVGSDNKLYEPRNYSEEFLGPVTLFDALGRSLNIPAVKLANEIGIDRLLESYRSYGFWSLIEDIDHYGLGLTLGSGEVSLIELVRSYSIFPNKGWLKDYRYLDSHGYHEGTKVMEESAAYLVTDILSNSNLRLRAFGINNPLLFPYPISIKTGTSNNWKDNWVIGYNKDFTLGVWVGNFSGDPTNQFSGIAGAGPLFHQVSNLVTYHMNYKQEEIWTDIPDGIVVKEICLTSGHLPNEFCQQTKFMSVQTSNNPEEVCDVHRKITIDSRNGFLASELTSEEYRVEKVYEYLHPEYAFWMVENNIKAPPTKFSPIIDRVTNLEIIHPRDGDTFIIEPGYDLNTQSIELKATTNRQIESLYWYVNGEKYQKSTWPYISSLPLKKGNFIISFGNEEIKSSPVSISIK